MRPEESLGKLADLARGLDMFGWKAQAAWMARETGLIGHQLGFERTRETPAVLDYSQLPGWGKVLPVPGQVLPAPRSQEGITGLLPRELWSISESIDQAGATVESRRLRILAQYISLSLPMLDLDSAKKGTAASIRAYLEAIAARGYPFETAALHFLMEAKEPVRLDPIYRSRPEIDWAEVDLGSLASFGTQSLDRVLANVEEGASWLRTGKWLGPELHSSNPKGDRPGRPESSGFEGEIPSSSGKVTERNTEGTSDCSDDSETGFEVPIEAIKTSGLNEEGPLTPMSDADDYPPKMDAEPDLVEGELDSSYDPESGVEVGDLSGSEPWLEEFQEVILLEEAAPVETSPEEAEPEEWEGSGYEAAMEESSGSDKPASSYQVDDHEGEDLDEILMQEMSGGEVEFDEGDFDEDGFDEDGFDDREESKPQAFSPTGSDRRTMRAGPRASATAREASHQAPREDSAASEPPVTLPASTTTESAASTAPDSVSHTGGGSAPPPSPPPKAQFLFRLEGDNARGHAIVAGAEFDLRFTYEAPKRGDLAVVEGKKFEKARKVGAEFDITVFSPGFSFRDGVFSRTAQFDKGKLVKDLVFEMKAPEELAGPELFDRIWIQASRDGRPFYEFPLDLYLVESLDQAPPRTQPIEIDADGLLVGARTQRPTRHATFGLSTHGDELTVTLMIQGGDFLQRELQEIDRAKLIEVLGKLENTVKPAVENSLWTRLPGGGIEQSLVDEEAAGECRDRLISAGSLLRGFLAEDPVMRKCLEKIDRLPDGSRVDFRTDGLFLPWEILYPEEFSHRWPAVIRAKQGEAQPQKLWGYRFRMECRPMGLSQENGGPISGGAGPAFLKLNINPTIDEEPANEETEPGASHEQLQDDIPAAARLEIFDDGDTILNNLAIDDDEATLIYLFCHGQRDRPNEAWNDELLVVDDGFEIMAGDIKLGGRLAQRPIVMLNSCGSGAFSPLQFDSFLEVFLARGACGLISTTFPIPTHFAAAFGRRLMAEYAKGEATIGEILYRLRRTLLERGNPLGLLYTLQCPMEARAPMAPPPPSALRGVASTSDASGAGNDSERNIA